MIELSGTGLTLDEVGQIVFDRAEVSASQKALTAVRAAADFVAKIVESDISLSMESTRALES